MNRFEKPVPVWRKTRLTLEYLIGKADISKDTCFSSFEFAPTRVAQIFERIIVSVAMFHIWIFYTQPIQPEMNMGNGLTFFVCWE
ncbi:hypothetical protein Y032_0013g2180 [Ancylostoma ceylanicum]|uniref:Uncharacterized protein n=1 Tax=Ancylostoma ceylanicum TaxID=53326 RepID=A0A016VCC7_9BILA|nr:hypothetical protein Y032_0013g2180 [Ancylostoma ceylanicum]